MVWRIRCSGSSFKKLKVFEEVKYRRMGLAAYYDRARECFR